MTGVLVSLLGAAWSRVSGWAALAAAVVGALGIVWLRGRSAGKAAWEAKRQAVRNKALQTSGEVRHEVQTDSDASVVAALSARSF